ncbi:MAG: AAA family ATPase [Bacteroidales bacterium]|nr:AAA family ATPase [Bacteroidales bacterium]
MRTIIGRRGEIELLETYMASPKAEFVAVLGRRRVGKTFLIHNWASDKIAFEVSGVLEGSPEVQYQSFNQALRDFGYNGDYKRNWFDLFVSLRDLLKRRLESYTDGRLVVFIDELPCFDTKGHTFVQALGHFWNTWAQWQDNIMLVVCGSATSWMVSNIIDNHGGLHNRVTHEIHLRPFSLSETEQFFQSRNFVWDRKSMLDVYMMVGGIPYYLDMFNNNESVAQGIDRLFFKSGGELYREFDRLFASLFRSPDIYVNIVKVLATNKSGLTRGDISKKLGIPSSGHLTKVLNDLVNCDFISLGFVRDKKISSKSGIYRLTDFYTLFYSHFADRNSVEENFWTLNNGNSKINSWMGLAFERVCFAHIDKIKQKLRIDGISTKTYSWRSQKGSDTDGAQIDMIIERSDRMINLCEIKYCDSEYRIEKDEDMRLRNRKTRFLQETGLKFGVFPTFVTTYGLARNQYSINVVSQVVMDDLF